MSETLGRTDPEVWRGIEGFEGYEVSNLGRVRSWVPWRGTPVPRILHQTVRKNGYVKVGLGNVTRDVHPLVCAAFHGNPEPGFEVAHKNGVRHDNRKTNLQWKTRSENHRDKRRHGTNGRRLSEQDVRWVRTHYVPGETRQRDIGQVIGVTQGTVSKIIRGAIWSDG